MDGIQPDKDRPYLIVEVDEASQQIGILNISSSVGKETKLLRKTNVLLLNSIPPL